jgi:hypothetical protein
VIVRLSANSGKAGMRLDARRNSVQVVGPEELLDVFRIHERIKHVDALPQA